MGGQSYCRQNHLQDNKLDMNDPLNAIKGNVLRQKTVDFIEILSQPGELYSNELLSCRRCAFIAGRGQSLSLLRR